jgi:membrane-associated phospholipid phosphatase
MQLVQASRRRVALVPAAAVLAALLGAPVAAPAGGTSRFPQTPSTGPLRGQAAFPAARDRDRSETVTRWIDVELGEIAAHRTNPPRASRGLAVLSVAMLEASRLGSKHQEAAVAGAASTVLAYLYPDRADAFAELADRERPRRAVERGRRIGARAVAAARTDGSDALWQGPVPVGPGLWVPAPPVLAPPLEPLAGTWRPWNIRSGSRFRPRPPPAFGSRAYALEVAEVYNVARSLTGEQKRIADYWADGAGTVTPPGHWNQIALTLIRSYRLSARAAARVLATLNTAQADAFIACWDAKFAYWSERPVTAIRRELDAGWSSYITTPPFPSYVSGHSSTSGAASSVLASYFPKAAPQLRAWAGEAAVSRLYGGIHFRSDNEAGLTVGRKVAKAAISRYSVRTSVRR